MHTLNRYCYILLVAESRPCDLLLTLAVDTKSASLETLRPIVNDVPGVHYQNSTLPHLDSMVSWSVLALAGTCLQIT